MDPRREARRGELKENDLVFVANGRLVENSSWGDHRTPATFNSDPRGGASGHRSAISAFGEPNTFCTTPPVHPELLAELVDLDQGASPFFWA